MKKRNKSVLTLLVLLSIVFLSESVYAEPGPIVLRFDFPEPKIVKNVFTYENVTYDSIRVRSLDGYGAPGEPIMPLKTVKILLPQDGDLESIEIITGKKIKLDGRYRIECGKDQIPIVCGFKLRPETEPNKTIYSSISPFPGKLFSEFPLQNFRGYKILILNLHPVQYIPKEGLISYFEDMTVRVNLKPTLEISSLFRKLPKDKAAVTRKVDNPGVVNTYIQTLKRSHKGCICNPAESYDYVIITNNALKNSGGVYTFQDLVAQKAEKGVKATIVTVEEIEADPDYEWNGEYGDGSEFFNDTAAHIRNFIKDAYQNWGIEYVLLGGDGDGADVGGESGDNIIPARTFYSFTYIWPGNPNPNPHDDQIPADLYYAALGSYSDGNWSWNNWNDDEDDYWGEFGEEDLYAEVYVGRAPVDSEQEVSNFIMKTIAYESSDEPYLEEGWMVGECLDNRPTWGGDYKDEIKDGSDNWDYTTFGFPQGFDVSTLYDRDYPGNYWPKGEIIAIINNGTHLINHLGHSSTLYVMKLCNAPFVQVGPYCAPSGCTDVDDLINNKYCFIYSQGCYPGSFDNWHYSYPESEDPPAPAYPGGYTMSDSIGEHFVTSAHGAFAVIMNSRFGWYMRGSTNGATQRFDRQFWDAIFGEGITEIGKAHQDSKQDTEGLFFISGTTKWSYYALNLLGDPEVEIWTGREFCVKNDADERVAWFDTFGNLFLKGSLAIEVDPLEEDPDHDEFRVQDSDGYDVAIIDTTNGNMRIKGTLKLDSQGNWVAPTDGDDNFRIQDSSGYDVAYISKTGDLYLIGGLSEQNP